MKINPIKSSCYFKNSQEKYKKITEKRAYINARTKDLEELSTLAFVGAFITGVFNIDSIVKEQKIGKTCKTLLFISGALLLLKWIKQMILSTEYDKELKNDTKNIA